MAHTRVKEPSFTEKLLNGYIESLREEYKGIVETHKKQIDAEFEMIVAKRLTEMTIYMSHRLNITDIGSIIKIEIVK